MSSINLYNSSDLGDNSEVPYKDWLMQKFVQWEKRQTRRQSFSAFARYLGVSQSSLSQWMAGTYPPTGDNIDKIAAKLGDEIYLLVGELPPKYKEQLANVPPEEQGKLLDLIAEFLRQTGIAE